MKVFLRLCVDTLVSSIPQSRQSCFRIRWACPRAIGRLPPSRDRKRNSSARGHVVQRGEVIANSSPSLFVQGHPATADAAFADPAPKLEQSPCDGNLAGDIALGRQDLADGQSQQLGDAVAEVCSDHEEHAVAETAGGQEVGFEGEKFSRRERAGGHAPRWRWVELLFRGAKALETR